MSFPHLLHHLLDEAAARDPHATALVCRGRQLSYQALAALQDGFAAGVGRSGAGPGTRIGIYLSKSFEAVAAAFGASRAGACFVPINPALKPRQVGHILRDCGVTILVTSPERHAQMGDQLRDCPGLRLVVLTGEAQPGQATAGQGHCRWAAFIDAPRAAARPGADHDMAAILYTSGSTGAPKGVVLSHRNLVTGAQSVASYLHNHARDRILALLPLSFDAGFSQLTTGFLSGACVVLHEYLGAAEAVRVMAQERVTGVTAIPPVWIQLAELDWPDEIGRHLRYFANTGGKMPREVLARLRRRAPGAAPYLMYGLTEAFRSTYLPPDQVERRPDSIGKAIPNQEVLVLRPDGLPCAPDEPGELVHRGSTVSLGYWNDPQKTAERFRVLPARAPGLVLPEYAVFSGDTVRMDEAGYLYFIGRKDEMIKCSGYRISPTEVEEAVYETGLAREAVAYGVAHERLGQAVALVVLPTDPGRFSEPALLDALKPLVPHYMLPHSISVSDRALPRNANGKIDRGGLARGEYSIGRGEALA
jgi:acyl-CoA ligase (AMP-forming) (exosortase A-associated)